MKSVPKAVGIVGCTLAVLVVAGGVLYFTGWLTWRWEASRPPLPADACAYIDKSEIRAMVPDARFESESYSSESSESMTCLARSRTGTGNASVRIEIDRSAPASGMDPAAERARSSAEHDCEGLRKVITDAERLARPTAPSDRSCGYAWRDGAETTAQVIAAQSVDTVSIIFQEGDSEKAAVGAAVVALADGVLGKLAAS